MEMNHYLEVFIEESKEHLQSLNQNLLLLEQEPNNMDVVNEIFRSAHTLKGMSATMGYNDLANLTHNMENILDGIRNNKFQVTSELLDVVFLALDHLEEMVSSIENGGDGKRDVQDAIQKLEQIEQGGSLTEVHNEDITNEIENNQEYDEYEMTVIKQSQEQGYDCLEVTVRLRSDCILKTARVFMVFEVLEQSGDVIKSTPPVELLEEEQFDAEFTVTIITNDSANTIEQKVMKIAEIESVTVSNVVFSEKNTEEINVEPTKDEEKPLNQIEDKSNNNSSKQSKKVVNKTIRVNIDRLDVLMNLFEELVIDKGRLEQIAQDLHHPDLTDTVERMSRISSDLQNIILTMRMVPVETVFNRFPRMIRQLSRELNKEIELEITGAETELDRTVIDEIGDPIVHLLRNAVDHGIESPEVRKSSGKDPTGKITLKAFHSGNHVFIEIEDDGSGINRNKVIDKAIAKGIITPNEAKALTDNEASELIMAPGFSTAETISDISGRGVGLDVVKSTIQSLGGSITIQSTEGKGSKFSIQLPLTLSIISALLVEVGTEKYAIPLSSIIETAIIHKNEILNAHLQPVIDFRGNVVPLISLQDVFQVGCEENEDEYVSIVIVRRADRMAALKVDSFIGQQEIVLKSLGNYLSNVFAISGATILGDGQVALIIDCNALIQ